MSRAAALAEAKILKGFLNAQGVTVSIELVEGARKAYGWINPPGNFRVEMSHHIASRRSQGKTPFLKLVEVGRPDVTGPLCNGYGGFDQVYRIKTMGIANHSGLGGPMTLDGVTIRKDTAAYYAWGTEFEGGIDPDDWPDGFHAWMAACQAGIIDYLHFRNSNVTDAAHCEHSTWAPGRKHDRLHYSRSAGIAAIQMHRSFIDIGYSSAYIVEVQQLLAIVLGIEVVPDGILGNHTRAAVRSFQALAGLVEDGDPGPITLAALRAAVLKEADVPRFIRAKGTARVYLTDGVRKRHIPSMTALKEEQVVWGDTKVHDVSAATLVAIPDMIDDVALERVIIEAVKSMPGGLDPDIVAEGIFTRIKGQWSA